MQRLEYKLHLFLAKKHYTVPLHVIWYVVVGISSTNAQCSEVPHWMFIDWISQMLPLMDKPEGEAVEGILHSISVDYPQVSVGNAIFRVNVCMCIDICGCAYRLSATLSKSALMTSSVTTLQRARRDWRQLPSQSVLELPALKCF